MFPASFWAGAAVTGVVRRRVVILSLHDSIGRKSFGSYSLRQTASGRLPVQRKLPLANGTLKGFWAYQGDRSPSFSNALLVRASGSSGVGVSGTGVSVGGKGVSVGGGGVAVDAAIALRVGVIVGGSGVAAGPQAAIRRERRKKREIRKSVFNLALNIKHLSHT